MLGTIRPVKRIERLPLYCGVQELPSREDDLGNFFPFTLGIDEQNGLIVQVPNAQVENALDALYKKQGLFLTVPIDQSPFTRYQADDFLHFMFDVANFNVKEKKLLEIGCSTGYVLDQLRLRGADAYGCEPGPSALTAQRRYGLNVRQSFFSADLFDERFDIVTNLNVLEHIVDPIAFLKQISAALKPGGFIFLGLPNCQRQLSLGDPGMILHEHWGYFTPQSLNSVLHKAGFGNVHCLSGEHDDLYAWAQWPGHRSDENFPFSVTDELIALQEYADRMDRILEKINQWLQQASEKGLRVALYGASVGCVNIWAFLNCRGVSLRLFDSDPAKRGRYLPGCALPIEAPEELLKDAPDKILILPILFVDAITRFLQNDLRLSSQVQIDRLTDMVS